MSRQTAFVVGATGYVGREVVRALVAQGVRTLAHVRPDSPQRARWSSEFAREGAEVDVTAWQQEAFTSRLAALQPDLVFALLGTTRARAAREGISDAYERIDYGLTAITLKAARASGARPRFVYLSALGARESTRNPYLAVRGRLETALLASTLPYLIARPAFITGADREEFRPAERLAAVALDAALLVALPFGGAGLRARYRSLTGRQVAEGLVVLARSARNGCAVADPSHLRAAALGEG